MIRRNENYHQSKDILKIDEYSSNFNLSKKVFYQIYFLRLTKMRSLKEYGSGEPETLGKHPPAW